MSDISRLKAPLFVSWQMTRACDLACLHCCTESAPGKRLADELDADEAGLLVSELIRHDVPYVMLCGGEPLLVPHFFETAEALGAAGIQLKIETNGQRFDAAAAARLARLPVRSIQISLDGASESVYARQRTGGSLAKAHAACHAVRDAGLPLEISFAPTRLNIHEAGEVIAQSRALGAFRFNTGKLMRIGTAARQWRRLQPDEDQYAEFLRLLSRESARRQDGDMELCYTPFTIAEGLRRSFEDPPATLLVLPNGWVKVAAVLPFVCGDLRRDNLGQVWEAYCRSWRSDEVMQAASMALATDSRHAGANAWQLLTVL